MSGMICVPYTWMLVIERDGLAKVDRANGSLVRQPVAGDCVVYSLLVTPADGGERCT
jgi:hypothetical protein